MAENTNEEAKEVELYELGFHLLSTLSEAELAEQAEAIKKILDNAKATVKASDGPKSQTLAYPIEKRMAGKKEFFTSSNFGSFVFEVDKEAIDGLSKSLANLSSMLRFLIMELPPVALMPRERPIPVATGGYSHDPKKGAEKASPDTKP